MIIMNRQNKIIKTSIIGIIVNLILVAFKATIGILVNSIAITLDAVNNLTDALSSIVTIIGAKFAGKAPDKNHPYGYGRIEYFSSIIVAFIVLYAGITALTESIPKIFNPVEANYTTISLIIVAVAIVVKLLLGRYVKGVGEDINSQSLIASGSDAVFDSVLSLSTLIAAIISIVWHISLEGILGVIIAVVIIKASIEMLLESINSMLGYRVDSEFAQKIKNYIAQIEGVHGAYDLVLHNYGPEDIMGSVHIEIDDDMTAKEIHTLTRKISFEVYEEFGIPLTVGIYATNTDNEENIKIKEDINKIVKNYPEILQTHGFYVYTDTKLVTFDIIVDFDADEMKIRKQVIEELKELNPDYDFYIILDRDFSD